MAYERFGVEEDVRRRIIDFDALARNEIGTIEIEEAAASIRQQRDNWTERVSGLKVHDWGKAPVSDQSLQGGALGAERQQIGPTENESVARVEVGERPFKI